MSNLVLTNSFKDSNVFLIELMFNCAHIKRFTFARRTPFKIVLAESRESETLKFFADIDLHSRLIFRSS